MKVEFPYNDFIADNIKQIAGSVWSRSLRAWLIPYQEESLTVFHNRFPDIELPDLKKEVTETLRPLDPKNIQPAKPTIPPIPTQQAVQACDIKP